MPSFGAASKNKLATCDIRLQEICNEAIKVMDFSILCGSRSEAEQNALYEQGKSKLRYPDSLHNGFPSLAVDVAPYPIDWSDTRRFALLSGILQGIAHSKGHKLRLGFDWDGDGNIAEHSFLDFPHVELVE